MAGFDIDEVQAEYIAEIKLRHLNREYILNRVGEIEYLKREIAELEELLGDELKIKAYIAGQLLEIKKKYGRPRKSQIIGAEAITEYSKEDHIENFQCPPRADPGGLFQENYAALAAGKRQPHPKGG